MTFSFFVDKSTTALFKALTTNNHFDKVTLTLTGTPGETMPGPIGMALQGVTPPAVQP